MWFTLGRRRPERFADLIDASDASLGRHRRQEHDPEVASLVALANRLTTAAPATPPGEDFRAGLRAVLMATIERDGIGAAAEEKSSQAATRAALVGKTAVVKQVRTPGSGRARAAAIIGVVAGALVLSGVSAASTNAVPGEPLYQVKRSTERAQLALAGSDKSRGRLYLELAYSRLREARQVSTDRLSQVLADMDDETVAGVSLLTEVAVDGDAEGISAINVFVEAQRARLAEFATEVPSVTGTLTGSRTLLTDVSTRVSEIVTAQTHGCAFLTPDRLGPRPSPC